MAAISDRFGNPKYGFVLATVFAAMLYGGLLLNRSLILLAIAFKGWTIANTNQLRRRPSARKREARRFMISTT
jgi:hypothetical protein